MKKLKRVFSIILCLILCMNMYVPAMAANENNDRGVTYEVTLDMSTINVSSEDQTVVMKISANKAITVDGIGFTVTWDSPLKFSAITGDERMGGYAPAATNYENGKTGWSSSDSENMTGITDFAFVTFTVPANTPAGTYSVGANSIELTQDYGTIWEKAASVSTMLTITDTSSVNGYTAGITTLTNEVSVEEAIAVNVGISHSDDATFAAGEIVVNYDATKLAFNQAASTLGTATINDNTGILTLEDYGADKNFGTGVYVLVFDALVDGNSEITMSSAAFVDKEDAVRTDLIGAEITQDTIAVIINKKVYTVTLPDIFNGPKTVIDGESYTFSVADGENYDYDSITATVDGQSVTVIDNGDGTYTVEKVTGNLVISGSRTEKTYNVAFAGNAAEDITAGADTATYNTDYTFTMPVQEGWAYSLDRITIAGEEYTGYSVENSVYRISGSAIKGDIVITVSKSATIVSVIVEGSGAGAASGYETTADIGADYTLTIVPEMGYTYTVSATMNGETATVIDNGDNTYTIENVTGNIVFMVERTVVVSGVTVDQYLTLNGNVMWLVKNNVSLAEGKVPTYAGENMFWSDSYNVYCYLVIAPTLNKDQAAENIDITDGTAVNVDYSKDVNITGKVDASDAQLTYNMYNAVYTDFSIDATMEKFLRADINTDGKVNVEDATAIITSIIDK